eukprot:4481384-Pleurochrysis_carterae.AAC.1
MWDERAPSVPPSKERTFGRPSRSPLFVGADGVSRWSSADSRRMVKAMAAAAQLDPGEFGGKGWRLWGATDMRDILGDGGAAAVQQRGRW